jgi:hypothetical protein
LWTDVEALFLVSKRSFLRADITLFVAGSCYGLLRRLRSGRCKAQILVSSTCRQTAAGETTIRAAGL